MKICMKLSPSKQKSPCGADIGDAWPTKTALRWKVETWLWNRQTPELWSEVWPYHWCHKCN